MKVSDAGLFALAMHEGIVPGPYLDSVGVWTYGIGVTNAAGFGDPASMRRGMPADLDAELRHVVDLFRRVLEKYEADVLRAVKVPLEQHQFDALVSFHYNTGAVARASLTKKLNAGDYTGAGQGMMAWLKPASLRSRREAERDLFLAGAYPGGTVPVWGVTDTGRAIWKPVRKLSMQQFLALCDDGAEFVADPGFDAAKEGFWATLVKAIMGILKGR